MISAIRHSGIVVADLNAALTFWCDLLGFKMNRKMEESGSHIDAMLGLKNVKLTTVKLAAADGNLIELLHYHSHPDKQSWSGRINSTGLTHIALTVTDIDLLFSKLDKAGFFFNSPPQLSPDGSVKVAFCNGPEGLILEFVEMLQK
ncbi:MAG: VOC family protein [Magnetococcales bacterium]|nr:VOC family protein [Magnetococcales bacterium]